MAFLRKVKDGLVSGLNMATDYAEKTIMTRLYRQHPDIDEVLRVMDCIRSEQKAAEAEAEADGDDDKWRPMMLTLGLIYKLQKVQSHWYYQHDLYIENKDFETRLLHLCGFYWHLLVKVTKALRNGDQSSDQVGGQQLARRCRRTLIRLFLSKSMFQAAVALPSDDILLTHATDGERVETHCPDFAVLLIHEHKQIALVICGTKMIPAPNMKDVFMDLQADAEPFLNGRAHKGMAIGAKNTLQLCVDVLIEAALQHPDYAIMITGYSLGAGIGHLVAMDMVQGEAAQRLPAGVAVRCITYGAPPVFVADDDPSGSYKCDNIFTVIYNNDGLVSASLSTVTKLLRQVRAVDRLQLRRRDMIKMLMNPIEDQDGSAFRDSDDNSDDEDEGLDKREANLSQQENWQQVYEALVSVPDQVGDLVHLRHPSKQLFIFRRHKDSMVSRLFKDSKPLTDNLRLRGAMLNHHMPWSYDSLFQGYGDEVAQVTHQDYQDILPVPV